MGVEHPLVSVIIPTYNRAHLLGRAIQSVLDQTYENFELMLVDDASTDDTQEVVEAFTDPRLRYVRHEANKGAPAARNTGIELSRGGYVGLVDSDDEWLPAKLERQIAALSARTQGEPGVAYCKVRRIFQTGEVRIFGEPFDERRLLHHNFVDTSTMVAHRACLQTETFDERLPRRQDWELCLRLAQKYEFVFVDEVLVVSHETPDSITSDKASLLEAHQLILDKHYHLIRQSPRALAKFHYVMGTLLSETGAWPKARSHLMKAVRHWPLDVKYLLRALLSCASVGVPSEQGVSPAEGTDN